MGAGATAHRGEHVRPARHRIRALEIPLRDRLHILPGPRVDRAAGGAAEVIEEVFLIYDLKIKLPLIKGQVHRRLRALGRGVDR